MGYGRILISGQLMREVFNFPPNTDFHGGEHFDEAEVIVSHPDIPDTPRAKGEKLPLLRPCFCQQPPVVFKGWGL